MDMRPDGRAADELREVKLTRHYTCHAEGSVLVEFGRTRVLCTASLDDTVPSFLKGTGQGWITAEYGMLPRATEKRTRREAAQNRQSGRTLEIQRLIGRSLRAAINLAALGERTIILDCDVIQADGGTRTASITGSYVALVDAIRHMRAQGLIDGDPIHSRIASVSVGIVNGAEVLDLEYTEDAMAQTDMNVVMDDSGRYIEIQGTAESDPFTADQLQRMLKLAERGIRRLFELQAQALSAPAP